MCGLNENNDNEIVDKTAYDNGVVLLLNLHATSAENLLWSSFLDYG